MKYIGIKSSINKHMGALFFACFMYQAVAMELPAELWVNIIARSYTPVKNALKRSCKTLSVLSSKNNIDIYKQKKLRLNQLQGEYALTLCAYKNDVCAIENLLRHGAYSCRVYCGMCTDALDIALYNKNQHMADVIIHYRGDFQSSKYFGYAVLPQALAAFCGDYEAIKLYLESPDYNPLYENGDDAWKGSTLLYPALIRGHSAVVELLLSHPKTIESINSGHKICGTPIGIALQHGQSAIVKKLLAIPSLVLKEKYRIMHFNNCAKNGYVACMKLLLNKYKRGFINKQSRACLQNGRYSLSFWGYTAPLTKAVFCGHKDVVAYLLRLRHIDVNVAMHYVADYETCYNGTPLYIAALQGNVEIVQLLLAHSGIKTHLYNRKDNYTALHIACEKGHVTVAKLLIEHSPELLSIKTKDTHESPYQIAYHYKQFDMVQFLLS